MRWRILAGAVAMVMAWALLLALRPRSASRRATATQYTQRETVTRLAGDAGAIAVADRVLLAVCDLGPSHPRPDLRPVASLLTGHGRERLSVEAGGLTAAQMVTGVTESAFIEAASVAPEADDRVAVWIDAVVTVTTPGRSTRRVAAPMVVDVVRASGAWLVDGFGEP